MWPLLLVVAILIVILIWFGVRTGFFQRPSSTAKTASSPTAVDPSGKMPGVLVQVIVWYLIFLGLGLVFMEISLLAIDFPVTPSIPPVAAVTPASSAATTTSETQNAPTEPATAQKSPAPNQSPTPKPYPKIEFAIPQSTVGTTPELWITVYGSGFPKDGKVRLNGARQAAPDKASDTLMIAKFASSDFVGKGSLIVDVIGQDSNASNSVMIPVDKPTSQLNVLNYWNPPINRELQLLLVIVFAGALGTFVHILKSATAFIGNGTMKASWFWWYITCPFVGAAMALIFYAVLRGGFLVGTPADEKFVNPFGVLVVGALVGMFSDKASLKLAEIFETIFRSGDPRGGKLEAPVINSLNPNKVQAGTASQTFKILGERLRKVTVIRFNSTEVKAEVLSDREVHFTLEGAQLAKPGTLQIVVVDPEAGTSVSAPLTIVGPKITGPDALPAGKVNTPYEQTVTASDCAGSCRWSLDGNAGGLTIDPATGKLTGTPATAGKFPLKVVVQDNNQQRDEKNFELVVN